MHSGELSQESLEELNLNRVTHNSDIGQHLVDPRSVPIERTSEPDLEIVLITPVPCSVAGNLNTYPALKF